MGNFLFNLEEPFALVTTLQHYPSLTANQACATDGGTKLRAECLVKKLDGMCPIGSPEGEAIFVGVRPSRTDGAADYGHLWLVFGARESSCGGKDCVVSAGPTALTRPVEGWIGYYPATPDLPKEVYVEGQGSRQKQFLSYFLKNDVPGMRQVDVMAYSLATRFGEQVTWIGVFGNHASLSPAYERARMDGLESQLDGRYGLNTEVPEVNNCVSWAAGEVLGLVLGEEDRFQIATPPLLRAFLGSPGNTRCRSSEDGA